MKRKIICGIKIYTCCFIYILATAFIYSFYLFKTHSNSNKIIELLIGISTFLLLGMLYSNMIHKRGLLVGLGVGLIHIVLINLIFFLSIDEFSFNILPMIIYLVASSLGGVLGIAFKKII